jgi:hypothetical protein
MVFGPLFKQCIKNFIPPQTAVERNDNSEIEGPEEGIMIRRVPIAFAFTVAVAGLTPACQAKWGMITVKVVDQLGSAVPGATVTMRQPIPGPQAIPECTTDETGTCTRADFRMGTYLITAMKPSDGYPNLWFEFYSHQVHPKSGYQSKPAIVELKDDNPTGSVVFTLGPKAAFLKLEVIDDETDEPVANFTVILRNAAEPNDYLSSGKAANPTVLLPPDEDIQVEITAPGYRGWRMAEHPENNRGAPLRLQSDQTREMTIRLKHQ